MRRLPLIASLLLLTACPASSGAIVVFKGFTIGDGDEPQPLPPEIVVGGGQTVKINANFTYTVSGFLGWKGKLEISGDQNGQSISPSGGSVEMQLPPGTEKPLTISSTWKLQLPEEINSQAFTINYHFIGAAVSDEQDAPDAEASQSITLKRE